jgi:hypothetical protein
MKKRLDKLTNCVDEISIGAWEENPVYDAFQSVIELFEEAIKHNEELEKRIERLERTLKANGVKLEGE